MNRDKIKIIEFGLDDEPAPAAGSGGDRDMRIVKFDDERAENVRRESVAKRIGPIKIKEFDGKPEQNVVSPAHEKPKAAVRSVKVKEFGKEEPVVRAPSGGARKIKILEFD